MDSIFSGFGGYPAVAAPDQASAPMDVAGPANFSVNAGFSSTSWLVTLIAGLVLLKVAWHLAEEGS